MLAAVSSAEGTQIMHDYLFVLASVLYALGASNTGRYATMPPPSTLFPFPPPPQAARGSQEQRSMVQDLGCKLAAVRFVAVFQAPHQHGMLRQRFYAP